ncbi:MAG: T9SS type A sorting domain-containing protein [Chloroherpetonaceae bacterium]|nr:T9SS type A sorting domain-containing protein [Chloroherpetonaceae bacterium]MDW8437902.1 choice-of-anchor V domain-containing protein [Chloroherpetonaceae bacterium]
MKAIRKTTIVVSTVGLLTLGYALCARGFSGGITGATQLNGGGCACHGAPSANVNVSIIGPDTVRVGATATYAVRITGGPLVRAGTNIATSLGALDVVPGSGLRKVGNELTHSAPKAPTNNAVTFEFAFVAPATPGTATLYANGNSVNLNGSSGGDQWNFAPNKTVAIVATSSAPKPMRPDGFDLAQNFPNPFNPSTTIQFTLPQDDVIRLAVFDANGREVQTLASGRTSKGTHRVQFDATNLASGVYFYRLETSAYSETKQMLLVK